MRSMVPLGLLLLTGCATARLAQDPAPFPPDPGLARTVIVEPLFEGADWQTTTRTEYATVSNFGSPLGGYGGYGGYGGFGGYGSGYPSTVAITAQVQEKPLFARPSSLAELQRLLLAELQKRRPSWRVTSTSGAPVLGGEVVVVRTIIEGNKTLSSDRTLKNLALGFGFVIWPLQLVHIDPVHETEQVVGTLERFALPAEQLRARLVRYPTQPDFAVSMTNVTPLRRRFGLDVSYIEGVLANEAARPPVLYSGFVDRLASAVIALVEEVPPGAPTPPAAGPPDGPPPAPSPTRLREESP